MVAPTSGRPCVQQGCGGCVEESLCEAFCLSGLHICILAFLKALLVACEEPEVLVLYCFKLLKTALKMSTHSEIPGFKLLVCKSFI